jgi:hypothetical protein
VPLTTEKQIAANRMNAQRSTGPKSSEGKAVSRLNAVTHGLTATQTLLPGEDAGEYEELLESLRQMFPSSGSKMHELLVVRAANLMWRLGRVVYFENGLIAWAQRPDLLKDELAARMKHLKTASRLPIRDAARNQSDVGLDDFHRAGRTFYKLFDDGDVLNRLSRYEQGLARQLDQTISRLDRMKALKVP